MHRRSRPPVGPPIEKLEWVAALKENFRFRAVGELPTKILLPPTFEFFLQPKSPLSVGNIGENWIQTVDDIKTIITRCQPAYTISDAFGESWDCRNLHFIIIAEEFVEDADPMAAKEVDQVSELPPLHAMHLREY